MCSRTTSYTSDPMPGRSSNASGPRPECLGGRSVPADLLTLVVLDEKATALGLVHANETINFALASLFNFVFAAATFIRFGLAVALSSLYPRWLGWVAFVAGIASIVAGLIQAYVDEPLGASRVLTISDRRSSPCGYW
jgi:hypothetical protein